MGKKCMKNSKFETHLKTSDRKTEQHNHTHHDQKHEIYQSTTGQKKIKIQIVHWNNVQEACTTTRG
jgi:hypothetical protein